MNLTDGECIAYLEQVRWGSRPVCPYCSSTRSTSIPRERRYHCNRCFNAYSVTVKTVFHGSHIPLSKWFHAIYLVEESRQSGSKMTVRRLAQSIGVAKNSAASLLKRITEARNREDDSQLILTIASYYHRRKIEER